MNPLHIAMAICVGIAFYGVKQMSNSPWWDIISGFVAFMGGLIGFMVCLFLEYA